MAKYVALVDDTDARFALYAEAGLHLEAVKSLIEMKDAERLEAYVFFFFLVSDFPSEHCNAWIYNHSQYTASTVTLSTFPARVENIPATSFASFVHLPPYTMTMYN